MNIYKNLYDQDHKKGFSLAPRREIDRLKFWEPSSVISHREHRTLRSFVTKTLQYSELEKSIYTARKCETRRNVRWYKRTIARNIYSSL